MLELLARNTQQLRHRPRQAGFAPGRWHLAICLLALAVVVSALAVVYTAHLNRQLYGELQRLERARDAYQVEWGQLLLEQSTWSAPSRVERLAAGRLRMEVPAAEAVQVVRP